MKDHSDVFETIGLNSDPLQGDIVGEEVGCNGRLISSISPEPDTPSIPKVNEALARRVGSDSINLMRRGTRYSTEREGREPCTVLYSRTCLVGPSAQSLIERKVEQPNETLRTM